MRMRIRNTPPHANVLNLKKKAYQKGKYLSTISKCNRSRPVKSIRKTERNKPSKSPWFNDDDEDDDEDDGEDVVDGEEEDPVSSPDSNIEEEDEEVDLPTVDRPYSKLISFQNHQQCGEQRVEGATICPNSNQQLVITEGKVSSRRICSSTPEKSNELTPLQFYSSTSEIIAPGKGSKNLAFLRQQLVDQLKKERGEKLEKRPERDNRINHCSEISTVELEFTTRETKESPNYKDFQHIADYIPIPHTVDDFDMSLFHNFPGNLDATEWEFVQELLFRSNIHNDQLDQKYRQTYLAQFQRGLEGNEEMEYMHQNLFPQDRVSVIDSLVENHVGSLLFSDDVIGNFTT